MSSASNSAMPLAEGKQQQAADVLRAASLWVEQNAGCEVHMGERGMCLVTTRAFERGDVILREHAAALALPTPPASVSEALSSLDLSGAPKDVDSQRWAAALHVVFPSPESRPRAPAVLSTLIGDLAVYAPRESDAAGRYRSMLAGAGSIPLETQEQLLDALLLLKFTSLPLFGAMEGGKGIFGVISKMNHACYPNCLVVAGKELEGEVAEIKAIADIAPGEELSFNYLGMSASLHASTEKRQRRLWNGFEFQCCCRLCEPGEEEPLTREQLCKRSCCWGKAPPFPPGGLRGPKPSERLGGAAVSCGTAGATATNSGECARGAAEVTAG